jgi:hypothetical protein
MDSNFQTFCCGKVGDMDEEARGLHDPENQVRCFLLRSSQIAWFLIFQCRIG